MPRKKLKRFAVLHTLPNLYVPAGAEDPNWYRRFFERERPLTLELACGWGEYAIALAGRHPDRNLVGVDTKGERLWKAARTALSEGLTNVAFLKIDIERIAGFFPPNAVEEIWITFPDPHPKRKKAKHRLTSWRFLPLYHRLLRPGGRVHLKTDDPGLFAFTQDMVRRQGGFELVETIPDLENGRVANEEVLIQTKYERRHRAEGRRISYLCFAAKFPPDPPPPDPLAA